MRSAFSTSLRRHIIRSQMVPWKGCIAASSRLCAHAVLLLPGLKNSLSSCSAYAPSLWSPPTSPPPSTPTGAPSACLHPSLMHGTRRMKHSYLVCRRLCLAWCRLRRASSPQTRMWIRSFTVSTTYSSVEMDTFLPWNLFTMDLIGCTSAVTRCSRSTSVPRSSP